MNNVGKGAVISPCGRYRYVLERWWSVDPRFLLFIMLNPSTADATEDDPTIRRLYAFTEREGFGNFVVTNLFAFRATHPRDMLAAPDPVGPDNDKYIIHYADRATKVVAAWGVQGWRRDRDLKVQALLLSDLWCLGYTQEGDPRHPLYVKGNAPLERYDIKYRRPTVYA